MTTCKALADYFGSALETEALQVQLFLVMSQSGILPGNAYNSFLSHDRVIMALLVETVINYFIPTLLQRDIKCDRYFLQVMLILEAEWLELLGRGCKLICEK